MTDDAWDAFLQTTPLGHFQQSSIWASIKAAEGWRSVRIVIQQNDSIIGGFQILLRSRGIFTEGFLNKGPVYQTSDPDLLEWLLELVELAAKKQCIHLLVAQAPDADTTIPRRQDTRGYAPNAVAPIITATLCVALNPSLRPVETRMRKTIQSETRQATRRGVIVREGGKEDIPTFFGMMCTASRRQNSAPNPPTESALLRLWSAFDAKGLARLTIADCEGTSTAGVFTIRFGSRVTQWKKGWNEQHREKHPNTLLTVESIKWAESQGAGLYDFVGGQRSFSRALLSGEHIDQQLLKSRYFFLLGFAAEPVLLPLGRVWIRNYFGRLAYRAICPVLKRIGRIED